MALGGLLLPLLLLLLLLLLLSLFLRVRRSRKELSPKQNDALSSLDSSAEGGYAPERMNA